jgi:hypothetical protein
MMVWGGAAALVPTAICSGLPMIAVWAHFLTNDRVPDRRLHSAIRCYWANLWNRAANVFAAASVASTGGE